MVNFLEDEFNKTDPVHEYIENQAQFLLLENRQVKFDKVLEIVRYIMSIDKSLNSRDATNLVLDTFRSFGLETE